MKAAEADDAWIGWDSGRIMGQVRCCAGNDDRCPSRPPSCGYAVGVRAPGIILLPALASGRMEASMRSLCVLLAKAVARRACQKSQKRYVRHREMD